MSLWVSQKVFSISQFLHSYPSNSNSFPSTYPIPSTRHPPPLYSSSLFNLHPWINVTSSSFPIPLPPSIYPIKFVIPLIQQKFPFYNSHPCRIFILILIPYSFVVPPLYIYSLQGLDIPLKIYWVGHFGSALHNWLMQQWFWKLIDW